MVYFSAILYYIQCLHGCGKQSKCNNDVLCESERKVGKDVIQTNIHWY